MTEWKWICQATPV